MGVPPAPEGGSRRPRILFARRGCGLHQLLEKPIHVQAITGPFRANPHLRDYFLGTGLAAHFLHHNRQSPTSQLLGCPSRHSAPYVQLGASSPRGRQTHRHQPVHRRRNTCRRRTGAEPSPGTSFLVFTALGHASFTALVCFQPVTKPHPSLNHLHRPGVPTLRN